MVAQSTVLAYEAVKSLDTATLTGTYQAIGAASTHPARVFKIVNNSNVLVTISTDGITDHDIIPASTFVLYDIGSNRGHPAPELNIPPTQFYAKGSSGTGLVYVIILYANTPNPGIPI